MSKKLHLFVDEFGDRPEVGDVVFVVGQDEADQVEDQSLVFVLHSFRSAEVLTQIVVFLQVGKTSLFVDHLALAVEVDVEQP